MRVGGRRELEFLPDDRPQATRRGLGQGRADQSLTAAAQQTISGREFFPDLISGPFQHGLVVVFALAAALTVLAILASALRGRRPVPSPEPAQDRGSRQLRKSGTKPV